MGENRSEIRKTMRTVDFFNMYISKFKYIILSNLMFSIFTLISAGYIFLTYRLTGEFSIILCAAAIIPLNAGMGGIAQVCRYIYTGKKFTTAKAFFDGVKENLLKCLFHGVLLYFLFSVCYFSILLYYSGTKSNVLFWIPLIITGLISLFVLFASYYVNIMTVTIDIKIIALYRNCALFSFGELKNNVLATIALFIFSSVIFAVIIIFFNPIYVAVMIALLFLLVIPSTVQYIITFYLYDGMISILDVSRKDRKTEKNDKTKMLIDKNEAEELSEVINDTKDEFIFYNGRMIKRSIVEKQLQENMFDDE